MSRCTQPPSGWTCSRYEGHDGPCAASPAVTDADVNELEAYLAGCSLELVRAVLARSGYAIVPVAEVTTPGEATLQAKVARAVAALTSARTPNLQVRVDRALEALR